MVVSHAPRDGHTYSEVLADTEGQAGVMLGEKFTSSTVPTRVMAVSASAAVLLLVVLATWYGSGSAQSPFYKVHSDTADPMDIVQASEDNDFRLPKSACFHSRSSYEPDMPGQDRSKTSSVDNCQQRCREAEGCAHISFWSDGGCHLSDASATLKKAKDRTVAGPTECPLTCFEQGAKYEPMNGAGPRTQQSSAQECHKKCQDTDGCATFTWWPDGGCHLNSITAKAKPADPYVISGPQDCPLRITTTMTTTETTTITTTTTTCYQAHSEYEPLDMDGEGRTSHGTIEECIERCHSVKGCAHMTYWEDEGCHLQGADATIKHGNTNAMSGNPHCTWACYKSRKKYEPLDMTGQGRTEHGSITDCQKRCRETAGCAHVSYWKDGGCHLADGDAKEVSAGAKAMAGPPTCEED